MGLEGEKAARRELERDKENFVQGVDPTRPANAPGFDAGGIGNREGERGTRVFVGEAKNTWSDPGSAFPADKFTAITTNLGNMLEMRDTVRGAGGRAGELAVRRLDTALKQGRVTFTIYLVNGAKLYRPQLKLVESRIRKHLRAFLRDRFQMSKAETKRAVSKVEVEVKEIST